jgi:hypothetical protein
MTPDASRAAAPAAGNTFARERLTYVMPDFTRISWVGDRARAAWEPRIRRIGQAWAEIEWRSIIAGVRKCALTSVPADQLVARSTDWAAEGLSMLPVGLSGVASGYASTSVSPRTGEPFEYRVAIGDLADVAAFKQAMDAGDDGTMGRLLGFPACCISFFRRTWVEDACVDTTWAMASDSASPDESGRQIEIHPDTPFQANILWRWMGVRAVPHLPCSFTCPATVEFANTLLGLGREIGYRDEMEWIEEILSWPVSWSALHGIAEVKTPVLKASTRSDATASEFVVRRRGLGMPVEAATGLKFPFRSPERPGITHSMSFQRGLEAPIERHTEPPPWYATDNGFNTRAAMDEAHRPIVELARQTLGDGGLVLDLGCGNGALLKKICDRRPRVIPFGMDTEGSKLEHARQLLPASAERFIVGNMFESMPLDADTIYSLVLLMPGRLLEVEEVSARRLRDWLRGHFEHLLVYAYSEWLTRHQGLDGLAARVGLTLVRSHPGGAAALARLSD